MLQEIYQAITRRKKLNEAAIATSAHELIVQVAKAELGISPAPKASEHSIDAWAMLLDAAEMSEADFRANVERYKTRYRKTLLAAQVERRQAKALDAEQAAIAFDHEEGARRRAALEKLAAMQDAARAADMQHQEALVARSDLIAGADTTDRERDLTAQLDNLREQERPLLEAIDERYIIRGRDGLPLAGGLLPNIDEHPALFARLTRAQLAERNVQRTAAATAVLTNRLALAEQAVTKANKQLASVRSQIASVGDQLAALEEFRLLPEAFPLQRATPSRDEQRKRHAFDNGLHAGSGVVSSIG